MTKIFTILFFIFISCFQKQPNEKLPAFKLTFISGCASITKSKINVYIKDNKYYADHTSPTYFDGHNIDSILTVELSEKQINACLEFLDKAKSLPRECKRFSSVENHHIIIIDQDTIDINGDCAWNNLDFHYLDKQLFGAKHLEIERRKNIFIQNLEKQILGTWYLQPFKQILKKDDIITLSRNKISDSYLVFGDSSTVNGNCRQLLDITDLKRYNMEVSDGWSKTILSLCWGRIIYKNNKNKFLCEDQASFEVKSIGNEELKLSFLWK